MKIIRITPGETLDMSGITDMALFYGINCSLHLGKYHTMHTVESLYHEWKTESFLVLSSTRKLSTEKNNFHLPTKTQFAVIVYENDNKKIADGTYNENY